MSLSTHQKTGQSRRQGDNMFFREALKAARAGAYIRCAEWNHPALKVAFLNGHLKLHLPNGMTADYAPTQRNAAESEWEQVSPVSKDRYQDEDTGSFGWAIDALEEGVKVQRSGWYGSGQYLSQAEGVNCGDGVELTYLWLLHRPAQGTVEPWQVTSTDAAAMDWQIVNT